MRNLREFKTGTVIYSAIFSTIEDVGKVFITILVLLIGNKTLVIMKIKKELRGSSLCKLLSHFDWSLPMIYKRTDARLTSSLQSFCGSFENVDNILRGWATDKVQKGFVEAFNRLEKQEEER